MSKGGGRDVVKDGGREEARDLRQREKNEKDIGGLGERTRWRWRDASMGRR